MQQITFLQLIEQAQAMNADVTRRPEDGLPMFLNTQYDAQPEKARFSAWLSSDSTPVVYGDIMCALLQGSLNLSGAQTVDFFTQAEIL